MTNSRSVTCETPTPQRGKPPWFTWPLPGIGYDTGARVREGLGRLLANDGHPVEFFIADRDDPLLVAHTARREEMAREHTEIEAAREAEEHARTEDQRRRDTIDEAFEAAVFKTITINVSLKPGRDGEAVAPVVVRGPSIVGLVVHRTLVPSGESRALAPRGDRFQITHAATGRNLSLVFACQRDAKIAAYRLSLLADWSTTPKDAKRNAAVALIRGMRTPAATCDPYAAPKEM